AGRARLGGLTGGFVYRLTRRCRPAIGMGVDVGADAAVGKLDVDRHAGSYFASGVQRPAGRIADQRKTARQDAAIGNRRKQWRAALRPSLPHRDELTDRASRAFAEFMDPLGLARDARA